MRGIVISPPCRLDDGNRFVNFGIDPIKIRQYCLYWDLIDFPHNNIVGINESPEVQFLKEAGKLKRTEIHFNSWDGSNVGYAFAFAQAIAFRQNNQMESGCWSLAQPNNALFVPNDLGEKARTVEIELYESIPIPSNDVPLEDVLEFKEKRCDELLEFRRVMDEFYLDIINSKDLPRAKTKTMEQLEQSVIALNRVMSESKFRRLIGSVKVELNLSDALKNALIIPVAAAASSNYLFGISPKLGAAIGLVASGIRIGVKSVPRLKGLPPELKDYAYLYHAERELI